MSRKLNVFPDFYSYNPEVEELHDKKAITPIFYVRGLNNPYNEGHIQVVNNLVKALLSQKIESIVLNYKYKINSDNTRENFLSKRYEQKIPFFFRETVFHERKKSVVAYSSLMEAILTPKFILTEKSFTSHGHYCVTNVTNCFKYPRVLAKFIFKNPLVVHFYIGQSSNGSLTKVILDKADAIVVSSKTVAMHIQKTQNIETKKIGVVYPPVDTNFYRPINKIHARKRLGISKDEKIILYIGNLSENRFPERIVLDTLKDVTKQYPKTTLLVFAPQSVKNARRSKEIEVNIKKNNLKKFVKVKVQNLSPTQKILFYGLSDLFLFPSLDPSTATEPPLTLLEAMASGLPVVSNDLPSVREIITEGKDGSIVSLEGASESKELTNKLAYLLGNEDVLTNMSTATRNKSVGKMALSVSGRKLLEIYENIFNN